MELWVGLDRTRSSCRFPCQITEPRVFFREREDFHSIFNQNKWCYRSSFTRKIRCCFMEPGLKPRPRHLTPPLPKPLEDEQRVVSEEDDSKVIEDTDFSSGICTKIEKMVFHGLFQGALELFEILECEPGESDVGASTYDSLIRACIGLKSVRGVKRVLNYMGSCGFEPDQYLSNRLLLMHVKCGMIMDARKFFDEMPERNVVSWNTIIGGLLDSGDYHGAFGLFLMMFEDFAYANSRLIAMMIRASAGLGLISQGRQLHSLAMKTDVNNIYVSCALIDMYSKCGSIDDARCVFDEMPEKTTVAWNNIIAGYALLGYSETAMDMYYEMQDSGAKMDHFTFSIILGVCSKLASVEHAKQAHAGLVRHGFSLDIVANTALMDFYSKWGRIEDAQNVFDRMLKKNVICWNALIGGYGTHGRGVEAVKLFDQMISEGYVPNHVTFLAVLSACSYSGLSDRGWQIFESMSRDYKVKPRAMHYACMIELLGREGLLDEAFALIRDAPFKPTLNMWAALLTACRMHRNFVLGKFAAEKLYGMEPKKLSNYVVLLNIYNSSGRLQEAADVVHNLKRKGLRMLPACTWIEIKKKSYSFFSGDKSHSQTKEIYGMLDKMMQEITEKGYVPGERSLLADVDDQEEELQPQHSEKLAVTFGIINTIDSTPLHLVQNHRICFDCHNTIKLISFVTNREIVMRDASRFHRFNGGACSCGDYW